MPATRRPRTSLSRSLSRSSCDSRSRSVSPLRLKRSKAHNPERVFELRVSKEVAARIAEEIEKRVNEALHSEKFQQEIEERLRVEKARLEEKMRAELLLEKQRVLEAFKRQEVEKRMRTQKVEELLEENERKVREEQKRLAAMQAQRDEERLRELERAQQEKELAKKQIKLSNNVSAIDNPKISKFSFKIRKNITL